MDDQRVIARCLDRKRMRLRLIIALHDAFRIAMSRKTGGAGSVRDGEWRLG